MGQLFIGYYGLHGSRGLWVICSLGHMNQVGHRSIVFGSHGSRVLWVNCSLGHMGHVVMS